MANQEMLAKVRNANGFIAALDQSGGSTPGALKGYGYKGDEWSSDEEMFGLIHKMRVRIISSPVFTGEKILGAMLFIGWLASGTFPLFMGVIPGESMPRKYAATAMGLVVCVGEIAGGTLLVYLAGVLADATGSLSSAILMMAACGAIGCVLCFFLEETAPVKVRADTAGAVAAKAV